MPPCGDGVSRPFNAQLYIELVLIQDIPYRKLLYRNLLIFSALSDCVLLECTIALS